MRALSRKFRKIIVYLIAAVCVTWIVRGVHWGELYDHLRRMNPWWIAAAAMLDVITTVVHGIRWKLLLEPSGNVTLLRAVEAIYTGLFSNEIFPLRVGELVRGYVVARRLNAPFSAILPSMVTERVLDGCLLVIGFAVSIQFVSITAGVAKAAVTTGTILLFAIAALLVLAFRKKPPAKTRSSGRSGRWGPVERASVFFSNFAAGMRSLRTSARFGAVIPASFLYLFTQVLSYWIVMKAYGLHFSMWIAAVVLIIVRIGTAVPSAPANIGPYQFFCVLALLLFGVEKTTATGFAFALWLIFSLPILLLGVLAFIRSGLTLSDIRKTRLPGE